VVTETNAGGRNSTWYVGPLMYGGASLHWPLADVQQQALGERCADRRAHRELRRAKDRALPSLTSGQQNRRCAACPAPSRAAPMAGWPSTCRYCREQWH
jgi:hypothetical protein